MSNKPSPRNAPGALALAALMAGSAGDSAAQSSAPPPASAGPDYRQMDFWIGTWEVRWQGGQGRNIITSILGRCAIEENFTGGSSPNGITGRSLSSFDKSIGRWRQFWADSQGNVFDLVGGPDGAGRFVLETVEATPGQLRDRMVFENITQGSFDWRWYRLDQGRWQERWHIHYRRVG